MAFICHSRLTSLSPPPVRRFQHASNERERTNRYPVIDLSTPSLHHPPQETVSPVALCLSVSPNLLKSQDSSSRKDHWYVSSVLCLRLLQWHVAYELACWRLGELLIYLDLADACLSLCSLSIGVLNPQPTVSLHAVLFSCSVCP